MAVLSRIDICLYPNFSFLLSLSAQRSSAGAKYPPACLPEDFGVGRSTHVSSANHRGPDDANPSRLETGCSRCDLLLLAPSSSLHPVVWRPLILEASARARGAKRHPTCGYLPELGAKSFISAPPFLHSSLYDSSEPFQEILSSRLARWAHAVVSDLSNRRSSLLILHSCIAYKYGAYKYGRRRSPPQ